MERGKRASMREGPLAALFRKTEDEGHQDPEGADRTADRRPQTADEHPRPERSEFGQVPEPEAPPARPEPRGGMPIPAPDHSRRPLDDNDPRLKEMRPAPPSARTQQA